MAINIQDDGFEEETTALLDRIEKATSWMQQVLVSDSKSEQILSHVEELNSEKKGSSIKTGKRILLVAEPGAGKSTISNRTILAYLSNDSKHFDSLTIEGYSINGKKILPEIFSKESRLPVLLPIRALDSISYQNIYSANFIEIVYNVFLLLTNTNMEDISLADFEELINTKASKGKLFILVDGWDEFYVKTQENKLLNSLNLFINEFPQCDLLVTTRPRIVFPYEFKDFVKIGIKSLNEQEIRSICQNWYVSVHGSLDGRQKDGTDIANQILYSNDPTVTRLSKLPLTLSYLITITNEYGRLPQNKAVLYSQLCDCYIKWFKRRTGSTLQVETVKMLLAYIAFVFTKQGRFYCTYDELITIITNARNDLRKSLVRNNYIQSDEDYIKQLCSTWLFGLKKGQNYGFLVHRQIQEYLTAFAIEKKFVDKETERIFPNEFFKDKYLQDVWREVIVFFVLRENYFSSTLFDDICELTKDEAHSDFYKDLIFEIITNYASGIDTLKAYDLCFKTSINQKRIQLLHDFVVSDSDEFREMDNYITLKFAESVLKNDKDYGYAKGIITATQLCESGRDPLRVAEKMFCFGDKLDYAISEMIFVILLWIKCNHVVNYYSTFIKRYVFSSYDVLRKKILNRNDPALGDVICELIMSDALDRNRFFDEETVSVLANSMVGVESCTKLEKYILALLPSHYKHCFRFSEETKTKLLEEFYDSYNDSNDLQNTIFFFSACYMAGCWSDSFEISDIYTQLKEKYSNFPDNSEQAKQLSYMRELFPYSVYHFVESCDGLFCAVTYNNELPNDISEKNFSLNRNNLAYLLRRKDINGVFFSDKSESKYKRFSVEDLLGTYVESKNAFGLINYALHISGIRKNEYGDVTKGLEFLMSNTPVTDDDLKSAVRWWYKLEFEDAEIEGQIVLSWLFDLGFEKIIHEVIPWYPNISTSNLLAALQEKETEKSDDDNDTDDLHETEEENTFTIINDEGVEIRCEILFTYEDEKTGKNYIAYTDNTLDEDGNTKVFASVFDPNEDNPVLIPIESDEEWELIENILESLSNGEEN